MSNGSPSMIKPAVIGGVVFGVAAAIPLVNLINCACCALILGSGFLAAYLYSNECKTTGTEFRAGNGALVGLTAAPFYAIATTIVQSIVKLLIGDKGAEMMVEWMRNMPDMPPEQMDMIERMMEQSQGFSLGALIIGFFISLVIAAIFSTLGGLIGGAVFKVEPQAPAGMGTPPPPPPTSPSV